MRPHHLCILGLLALPWTASGAELDSLSDRSYKLRVVVHYGQHRVLTPAFKDLSAREINDQLRLAFGALAETEVVRHHPLLADVQSKGMQAALDGWQELSDVQTHFVSIDYQAGRYLLQTRLHDGITGLNSPTVKQHECSDRRQVSSLAARLVCEGLGVVGTIVKAEKSTEVTMQGGGLGMPLDRWVRPGDIFAVTRMVDDGDKQRSIPLTWALLRISTSPKEGVCRAEYFCRYGEDQLVAGVPPIAGYRCLKLPVVKTPLSLRFMDGESFRPLSGLQVHIGGRGFQETPRELSSDLGGLAETREAFDGVAFVKVLSGGSVCAQLPIALIDERTIVCRLKLNDKLETFALLQIRRDEWLRRILEALLVNSSRMRLLNVQLGVSLDATQKVAQLSLEALDRDLESLEAERRELKRQAAAKTTVRLDLNEGEQRLDELRRRREELADFNARLQSSIKDSKSDKTLGALKLLERARLLENDADYEQSISLYEEFLKDNAQQTQVENHVKKLKQAWQTAGKEHEQARAFIHQTWPTLDIAGLKANLDKAKQAFKTCRDKGDKLTPAKLLRVNLTHVANLKKRLTSLQRQEGQDSRTEARTIAEVAEGLRELHEAATAFVREGPLSAIQNSSQ